MNEQEYKEKVHENIKRVGWHCTAVLAGENSPTFSYTVGLFKTHGFPELIIIGLPDTVAHHLLTDIIQLMLKGELDFRMPSDNIIKNFPVFFVGVDKQYYADYITTAIWFNQGVDFPAYQMVWPSADGLYPSSPKATKSFIAGQPILSPKPLAH